MEEQVTEYEVVKAEPESDSDTECEADCPEYDRHAKAYSSTDQTSIKSEPQDAGGIKKIVTRLRKQHNGSSAGSSWVSSQPVFPDSGGTPVSLTQPMFPGAPQEGAEALTRGGATTSSPSFSSTSPTTSSSQPVFPSMPNGVGRLSAGEVGGDDSPVLSSPDLIFPSSSSYLESTFDVPASLLDPAALLSFYSGGKPGQTGKNEFVCGECGKVFPFLSLLRRHKDRHLNIRPYPCDLCDKSFFNPGDMKKHRLIHTGEKPHVCEVCNKAFTEVSHLNAHMMIHTGARPHVCPICSKTFNRSSTMKKHVACVHFDQKPHSCDVCHKRFNQRSNLWKHQLIHTGTKNHVCGVCEKAFTQIGHLQRHLKTHSKAKAKARSKEQVCDVCGEQFGSYADKKKHMRSVHAKDRAFLCLDCGKGFSDTSALKNHTRVHTGEKRYACEVCSKSFTKLNTLKYHRTTHTGQKPFPCDLCKMSFMWAGHLDKHKRLIHHTLANAGALLPTPLSPPPQKQCSPRQPRINRHRDTAISDLRASPVPKKPKKNSKPRKKKAVLVEHHSDSTESYSEELS